MPPCVQATKGFFNLRKQQPHQQARQESNRTLALVHHKPQGCLRACQDPELSVAHVEELRQRVLRDHFVEGLLYGNVSQELVEQVCQAVGATLGRCRGGDTHVGALTTYGGRECLLLAAGQHLSRCVRSTNEEDKNGAIQMDFQVGCCSLRDSLILSLLAACLQKPFFLQCRTQEQLGAGEVFSILSLFFVS